MRARTQRRAEAAENGPCLCVNSRAQECGAVARDPTSASRMNSRKESRVTTARLFQLERHVCHGRATAKQEAQDSGATGFTPRKGGMPWGGDGGVGVGELNRLMLRVDGDGTIQAELANIKEGGG